MIRIVESLSSYSGTPLIESMFEDRKRLFVDLFGWDIPVVDGRFEMDQFDTANTVYIIAASPDSEHEASIRLMPSTCAHMLGEIFPHLCPGGVPVGPDTWESSRLCLPQRHGASRRRELRDLLISAMVDFALGHDIVRITGLIPEAFRKEVLSMGWAAEPLGPAVCIDGSSVGAFAINIAADTPARLCWTGTYVFRDPSSRAAPVEPAAAPCPENVA